MKPGRDMTIRIKDLRLQTIIGTYEHERHDRQDVVINVAIETDGSLAGQSDDLNDTLNYVVIRDRIVEEVETSQYFLLEKLATRILEIVLDEPKVISATVEVDKPGALHYADSVSVSVSGARGKA